MTEKTINIFPIGPFIGGGNIPKDDLNKIKDIYNKYGKILYQKILEKRINFRVFDLFKPANFFLIIDDRNIILIKDQKQGAVGMPRFNHQDFRGKSPMDINFYCAIANKELGFFNIYYLPFPTSLLTEDDKELEEIIKGLAERNFGQEFKEIMYKHQPPILSKTQIENFLDKANEDQFTETFLVPLFRKMGFEKITAKGHKEKILEFGQDIKLMKLRLPTDHYLYFVSQIKVGTIGASSNQPTQEIEGILSEIRPAFNKSIFDPDIGRNITPDHVYLITSGRIGEQAKIYLYEQIDKSQRRNLLLLERHQIIELYFKHGLPRKDQEEIKKIIDEEEGS